MVFMDTAATIPTGAAAERWKFSSLHLHSLHRRISTRSTPTGYGEMAGSRHSEETPARPWHVDFAGSSAVHMTGGVLALIAES